eukprot:3288266-Prymnesium_polylepis.1
MYDVVEPLRVAPSTCSHGCAMWSDLASDGNTRDQAAVSAKWTTGTALCTVHSPHCTWHSNSPHCTLHRVTSPLAAAGKAPSDAERQCAAPGKDPG